MKMRPFTTGAFCPMCEEWLEYVDWPSGLARTGYYDPRQIVLAVAGENEAMLREHMVGHTAAAMLSADG